MGMKWSPLLAGAMLLMAVHAAQCIDLNYWNRKKPRRSSKTTNVAAVRGVQEPADIDPEARDPEGVAKLEQRAIPHERVNQFSAQGQLNLKEEKGLKVFADADAQELSRSLVANSTAPGASLLIGPDEERQIGREVASNIIAQYGLAGNESAWEYVSLVGMNVARASVRRDVQYRFGVLDSPTVNALASPGGYIFVTQGLLQLLQNEAQLACVLAHEIAHVSNRHVISELQKAKMIDATIPSYVKATAQKAQYMNQVSQLAIDLMWKGLAREHELESDQEALLMAYNAGYDPAAFQEVLALLQSRAANPSTAAQMKILLGTHPKPDDRLTFVQERLKGLSGGQRLPERFKKFISQP